MNLRSRVCKLINNEYYLVALPCTVWSFRDTYSLSVVYSSRLLVLTVYIPQQPTLIKIDFFVYKCMLSVWLRAPETKTKDTLSCWNNPYPLQQPPMPFRCCCDCNIEQSLPRPPPRQSMCSRWRHSRGGGLRRIYTRDGRTIPCEFTQLFTPLRLPPSAAGLEEPAAGRALLKAKQCARVLKYFSSSALSSRRGNQFGFGQQLQVQP